MRFTVTWEDETQAELLERWLQLPPDDRNHLSRCVNHIDSALRVNAHQKGAVLKGSEPLRFYSAPVIPGRLPIGVVYQVILDDRIARVLEFWPAGATLAAQQRAGKLGTVAAQSAA
ncbi:MAG TPA: hypothetical protein VK137_15330 [Planctomycetaceae bacterium]|nr:hypothetical protein [Planctomycetaceae bacterium]